MPAVLQRLAQDVEDVALKLRQLVQRNSMRCAAGGDHGPWRGIAPGLAAASAATRWMSSMVALRSER